jgi:hypothetical protein
MTKDPYCPPTSSASPLNSDVMKEPIRKAIKRVSTTPNSLLTIDFLDTNSRQPSRDIRAGIEPFFNQPDMIHKKI